MDTFKRLSILVCALICVSLTSCSNDSSDYSLDISTLVGTKWGAKDWDYSLGDDWVGTHNESVQFFFVTSTEGVCYYSRKDSYSDMNASTRRVASHFKYFIQGNEIKLEYITDQEWYGNSLVLKGNKLIISNYTLAKESISASDHSWLGTIRGKTGECLWYSNMIGSLWIVGQGKMANYASFNDTPWAIHDRIPYNRVIVEEGVTSIGSYAFADMSINDVDLPYSLLEIGDRAFKTSLIKEITLSSKIKRIGIDAFYDCTYLSSVNIPDDIQEIGAGAFSDCKVSFYELTFGKNTRSIGDYAFYGGSASYLTFSEGIETIGNFAFCGNYCSSSKELILPNSVISIGVYCFDGRFNKITIGKGMKNIGAYAFGSSASSGSMYINRSTPPTAEYCIIYDVEPAESRWTLYVPKGCKSTYANKSPWNKFKTIIEDNTL